MENKLYGYAGKIARINLTSSTVTDVSTFDYAPKYIGGRAVANRIFWEEVPACTEALLPGNKLIYMTGPTCATGIPTGGRSVFTSISPNCYPEQYTWSGMGGWFGSELKFAGYDGFIIEGKASKHTYLFINDGKFEFLDADEAGLWGLYVHESQLKIEKIHGTDVKSIVIGPAGENLVRIASITTSNDSVAAKGGFGAVMGSKNLKAVAVHGTGSITPANIEKLLSLRNTMNVPPYTLNPSLPLERWEAGPNLSVPVNPEYRQGQVACSHGCNQHCNRLAMNVKSGTSTKLKNRVEKCVGAFAMDFSNGCGWVPNQTFVTEKNHPSVCKTMSGQMKPPDTSDVYFKDLFEYRVGDTVDFWGPNFDKGNVMMDLCNQYGIDKWDVVVWLFPWFSMGKKEGVFDGMNFGMEIDLENEMFVRHILKIMCYREGYYGNLLAEGMARAIRELGKEKFGDTIYNGRYSNVIPGKQLDIPISLESAWGHSFHWQGRGYQSAIDITGWLPVALQTMTSSRDTQTVAHFHANWDYYLAVRDDPYHNALVPKATIDCENSEDIKDSVTSCEWQAPDMYWPEMECEMLEAATGLKWSVEEMQDMAVRSKLTFRAILMRNFGRNRAIEANEAYKGLRFPDSMGLTTGWDEWNDLVDLYYEERGWDKETGWPTREIWEKYGLKDIADEMQTLGKLPEPVKLDLKNEM